MQYKFRIKNLLPLLAQVLVLFMLPGCSKKGCTDPTADNYDPAATESSNNCVAARDKFAGNYSVQAHCTDSSYVYSILIMPSTGGLNNITIQNLGDYNLPVNATVNKNTLEISETVYNNKRISGTGEISGYTLHINYLAVDILNGDSISCQAIAVK